VVYAARTKWVSRRRREIASFRVCGGVVTRGKGLLWLRQERSPKIGRHDNQFFEKPILNSPYGYPIRHWELDEAGQLTPLIVETRRHPRDRFVRHAVLPQRRGLCRGNAVPLDHERFAAEFGKMIDRFAVEVA
jgi:hypothetical protein